MTGSAQVGDALAVLAERLADTSDTTARTRELAAFYDVLVSTHGSFDQPPADLLDSIRRALSETDPAAWDALNTRPRTAYRLIVAGADQAAWDLLTEATRLVREGVERITPAYVHIDGARVFAWLPGFRDPRYGAPEECYELSEAVKLQVRVDDVSLTPDALSLAGTAYLSRNVSTSAGERITAVLHRDGVPDVVVEGARHRRPDQVSGTGTELTRRAWSGWSVSISLAALAAGSGRWRISLAIDHGELHRSTGLGGDATPLVRSIGRRTVRRRRTRWRIDTSGRQWSLVSRWQRIPLPFR